MRVGKTTPRLGTMGRTQRPEHVRHSAQYIDADRSPRTDWYVFANSGYWEGDALREARLQQETTKMVCTEGGRTRADKRAGLSGWWEDDSIYSMTPEDWQKMYIPVNM